MAKVIRCLCGTLVGGDTPDEAAENFAAHLRAEHPELAGRVARDDLIAMAEEA